MVFLRLRLGDIAAYCRQMQANTGQPLKNHDSTPKISFDTNVLARKG